jgi:Flp pilus assembly protein TadD
MSARVRILLLVSCLIAATVALYYPVSTHGFLNYDDDIYVTENPQVNAGLNWDTVKWAFTSFHASNWHPLTWLSHALDCQVFGLNPGRQHETNLLPHVVNVVLLFWVLWRATGYVGRSAMVAALFALHPINVESVAWIAERKNLLSMMFFLLALGAYRWYARAPRPARYLVVALLFAMGLMSKPQVITLPFVLLLWDYWPLQRTSTPTREAQESEFAAVPFRRLVVEKLPLLGLSLVSAVVTIRAQYEWGSMSGPHWQPFPVRVENAIVAYARYLGKAFWPSKLAILYPHPGNTLRAWQVVASLLLLLAITAAAFVVRHSRRYLLVGWLWFLGTLVPMIGLVQVGVQAMADRYAYLPFIGLFIVICWSAADFADGLWIARAWRVSVSVVVLLALGLAARRQLQQWRDNNLLWWQVVALEMQALQSNPNNWVAEDVLGHALLKLGQVAEAVPHFQAAAAINPSDPDSNVNIGTYEQRRNNLAAAIAQYQKVIGMTQNTARQDAQSRAQAFSNMGYAYRDLKDYAQARASFEQAVEINPNDARSWLGIGLMAQKFGDANGAAAAYARALKIAPFDWGYLLLADALDKAGRHTEAQAARRQAAAITRNITQAQKTADRALAK